MTIQTKLANQGDFLFRWRSYIPLLLLFPGAMALSESALFEEYHSEFTEDLWVFIGFFISMSGLFIRWITVGFVPGGTSGRNTTEQRASVLNTQAMYSIVKNPLYLGNYLTILGVLISLKVWWFVLLGSLAYSLYIERVIAAEERYLTDKFGKEYTSWAEKTPVFFPNFRLWQKPDLSFSYKTVLKREYNGLMAVCSAFFITEFLVDVVFEKEPLMVWLDEDWIWKTVFVFATLVFITLRTLKKHTKLLRVTGR